MSGRIARSPITYTSILSLLVLLLTGGKPVDTTRPQWTNLKPPVGARVVYVSSSTGKDTNNGLSPDAPKRSLVSGYGMIRAGRGDQLLLKRGDRFQGQLIWTKSGSSRAAPSLLGSYGKGPRPIIEAGPYDSLVYTPGYRAEQPLRHVAVVGIHFQAPTRNPRSPRFDGGKHKHHAIFVVGTQVASDHIAQDILIEDVRIEWFGSGIGITGGGKLGGTRNVRIRHTQIVDSYTTSGHMHGLFASETDGLVLEDSLIDNTQRAEVPGVQSKSLDHSIYIQSTSRNVVVRRNILARGPDGCMQRPGGIFEDNLVYDVEVGLNQGLIWGGTKPVEGGVEATVRNNAFVAVDRGTAIMMGNIRKGEVRDNLFIGRPAGKAIELFGTTNLGNIGVHHLLIEGNRAFGVRGIITHPAAISEIVQRNNHFDDRSDRVQVPSIERYVRQSLEKTNDMTTLLRGARAQSRVSWRPGYDAKSVIDHLRRQMARD